MSRILTSLLLVAFVLPSSAASKPHVITFGKPVSVKWLTGANESTPIELKVRGLYVDARLKEYTVGVPHDVTDRLFVVRRAYRLNDTLPDDKAPQWRWERGGWLLMDRVTGHISQVPLPEFDPYYSSVSWYRDYAAYCGISADAKTSYAVVAQLGRRKAMVKKSLGNAKTQDLPDSLCPAPRWQRPARVTFEISGASASFDVRGQTAGPAVIDSLDEDDSD